MQTPRHPSHIPSQPMDGTKSGGCSVVIVTSDPPPSGSASSFELLMTFDAHEYLGHANMEVCRQSLSLSRRMALRHPTEPPEDSGATRTAIRRRKVGHRLDVRGVQKLLHHYSTFTNQLRRLGCLCYSRTGSHFESSRNRAPRVIPLCLLAVAIIISATLAYRYAFVTGLHRTAPASIRLAINRQVFVSSTLYGCLDTRLSL